MRNNNRGAFLKERNSIWYIARYDASKRQTVTVSTGESDRKRAELKLAQHVLKNDRPEGENDARIADVLTWYWEDHAKNLKSSSSFRCAMKAALDHWGDEGLVSEITPKTQKELIAALRAREVTDHTIARWLGCIWAALNYAVENEHLRYVPKRISSKRWKPHLPNRESVLSVAQLAQLFVAARRFEHWWRYMVLAVGTAARPAAILELTSAQVDLDLGVIRLNPEGRQQNNKRRPTIPMAPTLAKQIEEWSADGALITFEGRPLVTREFFDNLSAAAGVKATPYTIRHTLGTWLASSGVSPWEKDQFMGHRGPGSATGSRYEHANPDHLKGAAAAVEKLFTAIWKAAEGSLRDNRVARRERPEMQLIDLLVGAAGIEPATTTMSTPSFRTKTGT